ncbi:MFS transporter [Methanospirillum hungatei]|uniref:MFS transporter n=1 Tax=Methanospirillum hungatei TaxID=2203 RepID=UPI0009CBC562|nr:MFS transporter [Methanospirillum hungatei]MBP7034136.1 MFS transporter [Methanospirillum sp.]MBP9007396.1 MFS transporter [Methanospirillum sp.]OQA60392.1 MAG: putative transporter [Euryarchaeota archaeon ADurb.Bin294]HOW04725.1 MFS transporter [Methanospirillum hungatei]
MAFLSVNVQKGYIPLIIAISLATFMASLDGTIVNIALPTISESFSLSSSAVSWVATIYLLVMAGCVLIFGKISDLIGFKRIFLTGFIIFTIGSFLCGFLPDLTGSFLTLIGSRAFQGVGGAMITAIAPAMVTAFIPMNMKGKAMGIIMTMAGLATAIGPTVGGFLTQYLSWHWIFFINVPVGIIALLLGLRVIPGQPSHQTLEVFDRIGAGLIFVGLAFLLYGFSEGTNLGWTSPVIIGSLGLAVVLLGLFVWKELHIQNPILEIRLFHDKNFLLINLVIFLVFFSFSGVNYLLPFYLEYVGGYSTSEAGLILTALSVAMMVAGIIAGVLYNHLGGRILSIIAAVVLLIGYFLITHLRIYTPTIFVTVCLLCIGFGLGLIITPISNMIMTSASKKYQGMVSSLTSLERFAPMTIGIAIYNVIFIQGMTTIAAHYDITKNAPVEIQMKVLTAGFDLAFLLSFILGIVILVLTVMARYTMHPDYQVEDIDKMAAGLV